MKNLTTLSKYFLILSSILFYTSINAQFISNSFDRAQNIGSGAKEFNAQFSRLMFTSEGESEGIANAVDLRFGFAVNENFELKLGYNYLGPIDLFFSSISLHTISIKPKFTFPSRNFSTALPIGIIILTADGEAEEEFFTAPELLFNHIFSPNVEAGINARYIIPFDEDADKLLGFNIGIGLGKDVRKWSIRPELGMTFNPGEDGVLLNPGISVRVNSIGKSNTKN